MQQPPPPPQPGGSQFGGAPHSVEMPSFPSSGAAAGPRGHVLGIHVADPLQQPPQLAEAASPISSRAPLPEGTPGRPPANFDELGPAVAGGFPDDEALAAAGEEADRGGTPGNRWPRQETLALLKIRSDMDAAFRDATFKGPLWEEVSGKLAELGYKRSAKKCKEKFENVHKYYKRTKEGRAGRQDGKTYRFFTQLEALHSSSGGGATATTPPPLAAASPTPFSFTTAMAGPSAARIQPSPISAVAPPPITTPTRDVIPELGPQGISSSAAAAAAAAAAGISFSSNSSSSSSSESDDEVTEEAGGSRDGRKRKRKRPGGSKQQMMAFFEGLMKQVMERQEAMQQRFLEAIEKREQDRMKREEAWRLQEMTRLSREHEMLAQERAMAASRDTAVISYLQKISGQSIPLPAMPATVAASSIAPPLHPQPSHAPPPSSSLPPQASKQQHDAQHHAQISDIARHQPSPATPSPVAIISEPQEGLGSGSFDPASSSRWPKAEVHALIKLRSELESRYQEAGPKGPLWEEISAGMQRLGYSRSSKRCKEKWENINKYFKKVKESNKKRPEDSKTCPYFHQLDALYRRKQVSSSAGVQQQQVQDVNRSPISQEAQHQQQPATDAHGKNGNRNGGNSVVGGGTSGVQLQTSNGGHAASFLEEGMNKPEDIVKELMEQRQQHQGVMDDYDKMEEPDSDNLDQDDDDDDDGDDEDSKMQYTIQFQRPNMSGGGGGGNASSAATTAAGSFLAMVQ